MSDRFLGSDRGAAATYAARLVEPRRHALPHWAAFGARFEQVLVIKAGKLASESRRRPSGQDESAAPNFSFRSLSGLTQLVEALGQAGRTADGLAALEASVEEFEFEDGCFSPGANRLKGELIMLQGLPGASRSGEPLLRQALDTARKQGALSWESSAATSLARSLLSQTRPADAIACLRPTYDRLTEGFGTVDLIAAKQLLDDLGDHAKPPQRGDVRDAYP